MEKENINDLLIGAISLITGIVIGVSIPITINKLKCKKQKENKNNKKERNIAEIISRVMDDNNSPNYKGKIEYYERQIDLIKSLDDYNEYIDVCSNNLKFQNGIELTSVNEISDLYNSNKLNDFKIKFENTPLNENNADYYCIDFIINSDLSIDDLEYYYSYQKEILNNILESLRKEAINIDDSYKSSNIELFKFMNEYVKNYNEYVRLKLNIFEQLLDDNKFKIVKNMNKNKSSKYCKVKPLNVSEKDFKIVSL